MEKKKRILIILLSLCIAIVVGVVISYAIVSTNASGRLYDNVDDVPKMEYGLLLGTSPITRQGAHNCYFDNLIKAAVGLYNKGRVKKLILSGADYSGKRKNGCNELEAMRDSLVARRVCPQDIILDYEGTRAANSIIKVKEGMKIDSCVIISQEYHNQRAIWLADHYGLYAIGYNAKPSHITENRIKNISREFIARPKMFLDLILGSKPKFKHPGIIWAYTPPPIEAYRDTLVGKFDGSVIDTLVAEPVDEYVRDGIYSGHFVWRVYTTNGTVKERTIAPTTNLRFVKEGDLNGDGKDEWGYITEWPTSNWKNYHILTSVNGVWKYLVEPSPIWISHLEENFTGYFAKAEDLAKPSGRKDYIRIKFSDIRNDGADFMLIDTLIRVRPVDIDSLNLNLSK